MYKTLITEKGFNPLRSKGEPPKRRTVVFHTEYIEIGRVCTIRKQWYEVRLTKAEYEVWRYKYNNYNKTYGHGEIPDRLSVLQKDFLRDNITPEERATK